MSPAKPVAVTALLGGSLCHGRADPTGPAGAVGELLDLLVPHSTGCAEAVAQQDRRARPCVLIVNARAVSPQPSQRFLS